MKDCLNIVFNKFSIILNSIYIHSKHSSVVYCILFFTNFGASSALYKKTKCLRISRYLRFFIQTERFLYYTKIFL